MQARQMAWRMALVAGLVSLAVAALGDATAPTLLRFKFVPKHVDGLSLQMTGTGQMTITGAPGGKGDVDSPLDMTLNLPLDLITDSVDADGNGHLRVGLGTMDMQMTFAEQDVHMVLDPAKGTMQVTANGKVFPLPAPPVGQALAKLVMVISPRGQVQDVLGLDQLQGLMGMGPMAGMMGGMSPDQMLALMKAQQPALPEKPVSVGDSWQRTVTIPLPVAATADADHAPAPPQVTTTYTLEKLETIDGHPVALVGMSGTLEIKDLALPAPPPANTAAGAGGPPPPGPSTNTLDLMTVDVTGEMGLPLDGGYLRSAHLDIVMDMETSSALPNGAGGGTMHVKMHDFKLTYDLTPRVQ